MAQNQYNLIEQSHNDNLIKGTVSETCIPKSE